MIRKLYDEKCAFGLLSADPAQENLLPMLAQLQQEVLAYDQGQKGFLRQIFQKTHRAPEGLYIWGGVGRGKSMMMDLFFESLPIHGKKRVHFHAFMQSVHHAMHRLRQTGVSDALAPVAAEMAKDLRLLVLDEMQISDITDAMIVGRLFESLIKAGVVVITTSNRAPDGLYPDGLNRALFLPFIAFLQTRLRIVHLQSLKDYRQEKLAGVQKYFLLGQDGASAIEALWHALGGGADTTGLDLAVNGRVLHLPHYNNAMARAEFSSLCAVAYGPADYLAIAQALRLLILENVPQLSQDSHNEAKRFVTLIDALYEAKTRLIISAAVLPADLYAAGRGVFEFERTASRLIEMQSDQWGKDAG